MTTVTYTSRTVSDRPSFNPFAPFFELVRNWSLILRLTRRELDSRYRGSGLGILWTILNPLLLLAAYTFVFSVVFQTRWNVPLPGQQSFAVILFAGLIVFNILSESVSRAPSLMLNNVTYIKKIVFPLEVLPIVVVLGSLVNAAICVGILLSFYAVLIGPPPLAALLIPVALLPIALLALGLTWWLSAVGVFIRDLQQFVGVLLMLLMFLSPIFYPISALPVEFQNPIRLNTLAFTIEEVRALLFVGEVPDLFPWAWHLLGAWGFAWLGYLWFMKTRKGFADVI